MKKLVEEFNSSNETKSEDDISLRTQIVQSISDLGVNTVTVSVRDSDVTIGGWAPTSKYSQVIRATMDIAGAKLTNQVLKYGTYGPVYSGRSFALQLNEDGFGPSDHSSFYGKQIPVLFFFTGTHLDYHKPTDTAEKVNYEGLTRITRYVSAIATSVDQNPTRPTYKVAQSSGQMGARTTFSVSLGTIPSYAEGNDGLTIDGVRDGGPAAKAGLKGGDKIIKMAGKDVRNISDYMFAMSVMKPDQEYDVTVKRGDATITMKIVPTAAARR
jgi:membrane-associated protease RseP (regulator of RpoE activity)